MRGITSGFLALSVAAILAGCSATSTVADSTPIAHSTSSTTPTASAHTPTPTPTPTAAAPVDNGQLSATVPDAQSQPLPAVPVPPSQPTRDPNAVDPADYTSHAWDTTNNVPLKGVEFMTADGNIICGIRSSDAVTGAGVCTPSTWKDIIPQVPGGGMGTHAVEVMDGSQGALYLYPDTFSQPARTIPVLPDGKNITLEQITCSVSGATVTCTNFVYNKGFTVSTSAITMHN
ncbi:hypothetical protein [Leifsonia sp. 2MCAF36]|uniref:hypothetical protein n=1 Tax=Leifsonia sp. 2MCAF36 TaxID=3232988 RepID=UPI003F9D0BF7